MQETTVGLVVATQGPPTLPCISVPQVGSQGHFSYPQGCVRSRRCWFYTLPVSRNTPRHRLGWDLGKYSVILSCSWSGLPDDAWSPGLGFQPGLQHPKTVTPLVTRRKGNPGVRGAMALPRSLAERGPRSHRFIRCALILVAGLVWSGDVKSMGFVSNPIRFRWHKLVISLKPLHPATQGTPGIIHSCTKPVVIWWSEHLWMRRAFQGGAFNATF